ncbi:hypothetical protein BJ875DRAFT_31190 [Amylocarpus encephaloides]|uniref:MARVEL domain-containing protein n=1 Tax=Amylocarpus encephaloides TaxID=45428 RepID=A0A9P8C554_9HELO|nr:hypothetical protein BJ875DRAFT_31190 [Amylocarpus encephaloides]
MAGHTNIPPLESSVPIPGPYTRQLSYDQSKVSLTSPSTPNYTSDLKNPVVGTDETETNGSEKDGKPDEKKKSGAKRELSVLIFLRHSRIYIRVLAIMIMIISFSLILAAVVKYDQAKKAPGRPLDAVPKPPLGITDYPCRVFTGVAAMNLVLSIVILSLSFISSKFRKSVNAINAVFAVLGAVGFATSMGTCFFLKEINLKSDLWKWSCDNHSNDISSPALDFEVICHVVDYGWKFGLVQASLELLTFIVSITAFLLLKYSYFARYGAVGKIF